MPKPRLKRLKGSYNSVGNWAVAGGMYIDENTNDTYNRTSILHKDEAKVTFLYSYDYAWTDDDGMPYKWFYYDSERQLLYMKKLCIVFFGRKKARQKDNDFGFSL